MFPKNFESVNSEMNKYAVFLQKNFEGAAQHKNKERDSDVTVCADRHTGSHLNSWYSAGGEFNHDDSLCLQME